MRLSGDLAQTRITSARLTPQAASTAVDAIDSYRAANARIAKFMLWNPPSSKSEFEAISQQHAADMNVGEGVASGNLHYKTNEFVDCRSLPFVTDAV
jgi:hypothetical protein